MRIVDIDSLTPDEKLDLIGELWDSLDHDAIPLTPAQIEELDRRLAADDAGMMGGKTLEEMMESLKLRLRKRGKPT